MLQLKRGEYVGVLYDWIEEVVIEQSPIIRGTWDEAMADARALIQVVNDAAEAIDDAGDTNSTVGRVDDSYCYDAAIDAAIAELPPA